MRTERTVVLTRDKIGVAAAVGTLADKPVDTVKHRALAGASRVANCRVFEEALDQRVLSEGPRIVQVAEEMFGRRRKWSVRIHAGRATFLWPTQSISAMAADFRSLGEGCGYALSRPRRSATSNATPAIAKVSMPSLQFEGVFGSAIRIGIHIATPKSPSISARSRAASSA
jgi:hypothetical protein